MKVELQGTSPKPVYYDKRQLTLQMIECIKPECSKCVNEFSTVILFLRTPQSYQNKIVSKKDLAAL